MTLIAEYRQQYQYRNWERIFAALPDIDGQRLLDLGCGIGDQAAALASRGAHVLGVDANEELLLEAQRRRLERCEFRLLNLAESLDLEVVFDGIWCSFVAAYFPNLTEQLVRWKKYLRPGGWIALTEIDDLFGHEPLTSRSRALLDSYTDDSLHAGRYDFRMGRKLRQHVEAADFEIISEFSVDDAEFSFAGPAREDVLRGWQNRFTRMKLLQAHCGAEFGQVRDEFLACLERSDHFSRAKVSCVVAQNHGDAAAQKT